MMEDGLTLLTRYFSDFTTEQEKQFSLLGPLYREWNDKINVISRKDIDSLYEKHVLHSLAVAAVINFSPASDAASNFSPASVADSNRSTESSVADSNRSSASPLQVLDLGTGGGFPGLPLAILYPEVQFTLVDSIGKKLKVVDAVSEAIGLQNLRTRHTRVEEIRDQKFDFVVSRAVAPLKDLWTWSRHLIRNERKLPDFKNGMIFLKGGDLAAEISESRLRPHVWDISTIYEEEWYKEKYVLYVPA